MPLAGLELVEWSRFAQPDGNAVGEVPAALRALANEDEADLSRSCNRLLFALGNAHAGTYCPVVLPVLPFLGQLLRGSALVVRLRALDVLIDLVASFEPEQGHDYVETDAGPRSLQACVIAAAERLLPDVERLHTHPASHEEARLAAELLWLFRVEDEEVARLARWSPEQAEVFRSRLAETLAWLELANPLRLVDGAYTNTGALTACDHEEPSLRASELIERRAALLVAAGRARELSPVLPKGRLLLLLTDLNLHDGCAADVTGGFYDEHNFPPPDTWVHYFDVLQTGRGTPGPALACWIPRDFYVLAERGATANPEQCLVWADQHDGDTGPRSRLPWVLRLRVWMRQVWAMYLR